MHSQNFFPVMLSAIVALAISVSAWGSVEFNSGQYEPVDYGVYDTIAIDSTVPYDPGTHVELLEGGLVDGAVYAYNDSTFTLSGGTVNGRLNAHDDCNAEIMAGSIWMPDGNVFFAYESSSITFYGTSFTVDGKPVTPGVSLRDYAAYNGYFYRGELNGVLLDGSMVHGDFFIYANADMVVVPEPCVLTLLAIGTIGLIRRR